MTDDEARAAARPMSVEAHIAVQTVELGYIKKAVDRIEAAQGAYVSHNAWEQRNGYVDGKFEQVHAEIANVKQENGKALDGITAEMQSQRAPWWVVLGAGLGIIGAVVGIMSVLAR